VSLLYVLTIVTDTAVSLFVGGWLGRFLTRYPFGQRAFTGKESLIGRKATVVTVKPGFYEVRLDSQIWKAVCDDPLGINEAAEVSDLSGNKLTLRKIR